MAVLRVYPQGYTLSRPRAGSTPPLRTASGGWSRASTRSLMAALRSIVFDRLTGDAYAVSLTVRDCPPTPAEWHRLVDAWLKRARRLGALRYVWLTEWQRRRVPHLHAVLWLPEGADAAELVGHWVAAAAPFGARAGSQTVQPIRTLLGWLQYLGVHSSRGIHHYQRSRRSIPPAWQGLTGRMWGRSRSGWSDGERRDPLDLVIPDRLMHRLRRVARRRRIAQARALPRPAVAIVAARRCLRCTDPAMSWCRGLDGGWLDQDSTLRLLELLTRPGDHIAHREAGEDTSTTRSESDEEEGCPDRRRSVSTYRRR